MNAAAVLCALGHIATTARLHEAGLPRRSVASLLHSGAAVRPRRGLFVCVHLPPLQRYAAALGARLDCVSVLREHGIWAGEDLRLHLRVPEHGDAPQLLAAAGDAEQILRGSGAVDTGPDASGIRHSDPSRGTVTHWLDDSHGRQAFASPASVSLTAALAQSMHCLEPDDVVAALESASYRGLLTPAQLDELCATAPRRVRGVLAEMDHGAQSGIETRVRLGLRRLGFRVEPQAFLPGVGHVDNLVEDCVAVESDGRLFHQDSLETDYDRDLASEYIGVRVLRVSPRIVLHEWPALAATVTTMVQMSQAADPVRRRRR